jgi:hypothetical protein
MVEGFPSGDLLGISVRSDARVTGVSLPAGSDTVTSEAFQPALIAWNQTFGYWPTGSQNSSLRQ